MPRLSVLLPAHNAEPFLAEGIGSILSQTFRDFELIVVDDASTDGTIQALQQFKDPRIRILKNDINLGVTRSLNKALDAARTELVARMDADDISHPERFERQISLLDSRPEIGICGTWAETFGTSNQSTFRYPVEHDEIRCSLLLFNPLAHSSVIFRRELGLRYDENYLKAQDYELWARAAETTQLHNLPAPLLRYRLHTQQVSTQGRGRQGEVAGGIRSQLLDRLRAPHAPEFRKLHEWIASSDETHFEHILRGASDWLEILIEANKRNPIYPEASFKTVLIRQLFGALSTRIRHPRTVRFAEWLQIQYLILKQPLPTARYLIRRIMN